MAKCYEEIFFCLWIEAVIYFYRKNIFLLFSNKLHRRDILFASITMQFFDVVLATIPLFDLKHPHNIDCLIDLIPCFDEKKTTDACHPAFLKAVVDNLFGTDHKLHKSL